MCKVLIIPEPEEYSLSNIYILAEGGGKYQTSEHK